MTWLITTVLTAAALLAFGLAEHPISDGYAPGTGYLPLWMALSGATFVGVKWLFNPNVHQDMQRSIAQAVPFLIGIVMMAMTGFSSFIVATFIAAFLFPLLS